MGARVLVAYASKHGATAEIAQKIGEILRQVGLSVDVRSADRAGDAASYRAVVLGSAVYVGQWRREAAKFLKDNEKVLAERPVWLFSSGPTGQGDPVALTKGWRFPKALEPIADRIRPRDIALFHGAIEPGKMGVVERLLVKNVNAPFGDFRDLEAVTSWATAIADALKKQNV